MIEVKNVTKTYGKKQNLFTALDDVTLSIPDGASVAILGRSGSGKSTLMHVMSGLDRPETGEIIVDGEDILKLKTKQIDKFRATKMSFIFQSFFVQANESCFDNVSLPLEIANLSRSKRRAKVDQALAAVELTDKKKSRARNLSGGQKQRLAIARAIVNDPQILFADEPTGNLDSTTGTTLIIVTHDPELAAKCDIKIHIKDGKVQSIEKKGHAADLKNVTSRKVQL